MRFFQGHMKIHTITAITHKLDKKKHIPRGGLSRCYLLPILGCRLVSLGRFVNMSQNYRSISLDGF